MYLCVSSFNTQAASSVEFVKFLQLVAALLQQAEKEDKSALCSVVIEIFNKWKQSMAQGLLHQPFKVISIQNLTGFIIYPECPWCSDGEEPACNAGDPGSDSGLGRSPGEGNCYPLRYSCLENFMDRGASQATVHGVTESAMTERLTLSLSWVIKPFSSSRNWKRNGLNQNA